MNNHIDTYLQYLTHQNRTSKNTRMAYISDIRQFEQYLRKQYNKPLIEATKTMVLTYMLAMQKDMKLASTVSRNLSSIKSFYQYLENKGIIVKNPATQIHGPKIDHKTPDYFTVREVNLLLSQPDISTPKGLRDKGMLELMYATGLKVSELIQLKVKDYSKVMETLTIVSGKQSRRVPLSDCALNHLNLYLEQGRSHYLKDKLEDTLFLNNLGKPLTRQGFWKILKQYAVLANIEKPITPQSIRNSFVVHLLENGVDMATIQSLFGQESIQILQKISTIHQTNTFETIKKRHPRK